MSPLDQAMSEAVAKVPPEHIEKLKIGINMLLAGFVNDNVHVLLLLGAETSLGTTLQEIMTVDCTDIQAQQLVEEAMVRIEDYVMADAPPKELWN